MRRRKGKRETTSEASLVARFARCLRSGDAPWGPLRVGFEFDYMGGSADIYALSEAGTLIAFEAKLARWREALHQAYRTRCFAQRAYVVLPRVAATKAVNQTFEFLRRGVGLCTIEKDGAIVVLIESDPAAPLLPWMTELAIVELSKRRGGRCRPIQSSKSLHSQSVPLAA